MVFGDIEWTEVSKVINSIECVNKSQSTFSHMSTNECQKYFEQVIARYLFVLTVSDSHSMASKMWSFFPIIHSIDLNPYLDRIIAKIYPLLSNISSL